MKPEILRGHISFVNYEKNFATIDYSNNGKQKSVNCKTNITENGKKPHYFRVGDHVSFELRLSDRGDKMTATSVKFLYNTQLELILQKTDRENRLDGFLKKVEDKWLIKERESYIFFPLQLSPWEKEPAEQAMNEVINFKLLNRDKPGSLVAELFSHDFIPEYRKAQQAYKDKTPVDAVVTRISPYAVYLSIFGGKLTAKINIDEHEREEWKEGENLQVVITYMNAYRVVVEKAVEA